MKHELSMLQIGLIASPIQTSGSDRYYFELIHALRERGDRVKGVVLGNPESLEHSSVGIESFAPEGSGALKRWGGLRRTVARLIKGTSIVVSHFAAHAFPVLDQLGKRPLVAHFHNPWLHEGRAQRVGSAKVALRWLQERAVYARTSRFIVLSKANAQVLENSYGVSRSRIRVIAGGTDLSRFAPSGSRQDARARLNWPIDRPTLVIVARLVLAKGIDRAIAAIPIIRESIPNISLSIVGAGPEDAPLRAQARALDVSEHVCFRGFQREGIADAYRAADLVLVPSIAFESFGLVAAEALACGTPALVTPLLGLPEVVSSLDEELILDGMTPNDISNKVVAALTGRLALPSPSACSAYAQRFDWKSVAAAIHDVYTEVA